MVTNKNNYKKLYLKYKLKYKSTKKILNNKIVGGKKNKPNYTEHVSEPWFSFIKIGLKTVEGRLNKGRFEEMKVGQIVEWKNNDFSERTVLTKIIAKNKYASFAEYLNKEKLRKCLPGFDTNKEGVDVYYKYYSKEKEEQYGIVAIHLELLKSKQN